MRLRVEFGAIDQKELNWYKDISDFPKLIHFLGRNYEWVTYYPDPLGKVDQILVFTQLASYDPFFSVLAPTWTEIAGEPIGGCECGSTPKDPGHMMFCRLWRKN